MKFYLSALRNYARFSGRAQRAEFWWFQLFNQLVGPIVLLLLESIADQLAGRTLPEVATSISINLFYLATLVPSISIGVRRMHDTNHRGWWILCPLVNLAFAVTEGDEGPNRFGPANVSAHGASSCSPATRREKARVLFSDANQAEKVGHIARALNLYRHIEVEYADEALANDAKISREALEKGTGKQ